MGCDYYQPWTKDEAERVLVKEYATKAWEAIGREYNRAPIACIADEMTMLVYQLRVLDQKWANEIKAPKEKP